MNSNNIVKDVNILNFVNQLISQRLYFKDAGKYNHIATFLDGIPKWKEKDNDRIEFRQRNVEWL